MDLAQTLVRSVMRGFYDTRSILIIDALVIHSTLRDDDLAYLIGMNTKELHKVCAKLRDDRFLVVHVRAELREGQQRPVNRTYYYIDYRQTIDAIKWRVYKLDKDMQGVAVPANERKEYFCSHCEAEWTQMEVLDSAGPEGFVCHQCGHVLTRDLERNSTGHQKSRKMNAQLQFITDLLPQIDSVVVPDNNFDVAFSKARPVERDEQHRVAHSVGADSVLNRPTAVKGLQNTGPKSMLVNISTTDGPTEEERAAERERKEKIAKQNALPSWMSQSTITGESFDGGQTITTVPGGLSLPGKTEDTKDAAQNGKNDSELDDYFERLKAEAAAAAAKKEEEDEEEDEDDEGDFEDVMATGTSSSVATPAGALGTTLAPVAPSPLRQSSIPPNGNGSNGLKRDSSGNSNSTSGNATGGEDNRPVKRVKVEEPPTVSISAPAAAVDGDDDDEDDMEFEDAM